MIYKITKRIMAAGLVFILSFLCIPVQDIHAESRELLKDEILVTSEMLSQVFGAQYEGIETCVKQSIRANGYDYELTMQTFYNQGNPFKDADYISFISTYIVLKDLSKEYGIPMQYSMSDIPYVTLTISENSIVEYEPVKREKYIATDNDFYIQDGYYYICEPLEVPIYEGSDDEGYQIVGYEEIIPDKIRTYYGECFLNLITPEQMFEMCSIPYNEDAKIKLEDTSNKLYNTMQNAQLSQGLLLETSIEQSLSDDIINVLNNLVCTSEQGVLLETAISLLGKVPYEWGGKASHAGYDTTWWSIRSNGNQKGLDCSGYVQWVLMTAGVDTSYTDKMASTSQMLSSGLLEPCSYEELEPGDFGFLNHGESVNHVGIYIGDGYFIHCSSGSGTVVIDKCPFKVFRKNRCIINSVDDTTKNGVLYKCDNFEKNWYNEHGDIYLIAQVVTAEAGSEGINGWIGVTEVIKNRMISDEYPNTAREVIMQQGQFSTVSKLPNTVPSDEIIWTVTQVMEGNLSLLEPDVLYFRNATMSGDNPEDDWNSHKFYKLIGNHSFYHQ